MAEERQVCPSCREPVYATDTVCMSCGADLRIGAASSAPAESAPAPSTGPAPPPAGVVPAAPGAPAPPVASGTPSAVQPGALPERPYWAGQEDEPEWYTQEELEEAERREATILHVGKTACCIAWGIGSYFLFAIFASVGGIVIAVAPLLVILVPLVYLVILDAHEWIAVNPKIMIPIVIVGVCFSVGMFVWAWQFGLFE